MSQLFNKCVACFDTVVQHMCYMFRHSCVTFFMTKLCVACVMYFDTVACHVYYALRHSCMTCITTQEYFATHKCVLNHLLRSTLVLNTKVQHLHFPYNKIYFQETTTGFLHHLTTLAVPQITENRVGASKETHTLHHIIYKHSNMEEK